MLKSRKDKEKCNKPKRYYLDGNATLQKLQNFSKACSLSNDSVIYLYTNKTPVDDFYGGAALPGIFSTFATFGTFCSDNKSAAIVVLRPGSSSYWTTVSTTARIFGSRNFDKFSVEDIKNMKQIFSFSGTGDWHWCRRKVMVFMTRMTTQKITQQIFSGEKM
uniref:Uncharacterized protein n=1 Tax=Rhipicephalus microplus TaxID=6941 RepID=A0A6G5A409_RHIMP